MELNEDLVEKKMSNTNVLYRRAIYCYNAATNIMMNNACILGSNKSWNEDEFDNVEDSAVMLYDIFLKAALLELACSDSRLDFREVELIDKICLYADLYDLMDVNTCFMYATNGVLREKLIECLVDNYGSDVLNFYKLILNEDRIYKNVIIDCTISICSFLVSIDGVIGEKEEEACSKVIVKYFS